MAIRFVKISSPEPAADHVAQLLATHLRSGQKVLWQISGGSVIPLAAAIAKRLAGETVEHLSVTLVDERLGPVGHPDSNWQGLMDAGFSLPGARLHPVLTGATTAADTASFNTFLRTQLERSDFRIGLFGIGPDGHTAGLPAANAAPTHDLAHYYEAGSFRRISSTPEAISRLDQAVVFAMGANKHEQLDRFQTDLPYEEQSAQALKLAPQVSVFNDYKGDPQ